jgi:transposase
VSTRAGTGSSPHVKGENTTMTCATTVVTAGVDTHARAHRAAALDQYGRLLGSKEFPATACGYRQLLAWLHSHGTVKHVGVEGTGSYGVGLTRVLRDAGIAVIEINRPHAHTRARRGKTDLIDAEAAARKVQAEDCDAVPKDTTGIVEAIRQLHLVRRGAVKARTAALTQLGELLVTAPAAVRESIPGTSLKAKAVRCRRLRVDPGRLNEPAQAAKWALRTLAGRIQALTTEIAALDTQLSALVRTAAPRTLALSGVGVQLTAQLLVSAGQNIDRLRSEAAFAHLCAAGPIEVSSGKTHRHRLDRGGDRQANRALHMIVVVRLRYCPRTRAYLARRTAQGLSKKDVMRCLKRYVAREVYYSLRADLAALSNAAASVPAAA